MARTDITKHATAETRRKGALAATAKRVENAKTFRQRLADKLDAQADEVIANLLAAGESDWRASIAAIEQAHGKVPQALELSGPDGERIEVNLGGDPDRLSRVAALLAEAEAAGTGTPPDPEADQVHPAQSD